MRILLLPQMSSSIADLRQLINSKLEFLDVSKTEVSTLQSLYMSLQVNCSDCDTIGSDSYQYRDGSIRISIRDGSIRISISIEYKEWKRGKTKQE